MLLTIRHTSRYTYDSPVSYAVQRLRLRPRSASGQMVREWALTVTGATKEAAYTDGYGNRTDLVRHERDATEIVITATGIVETEDRTGVYGVTQSFVPVWLFERQTALTAPGDAIRELAATLPVGADRLATLHQLMDTLNARVKFLVGATTAATPAEAALAAGEGVCQDHAHVFLSVARVLQIPARYVSGYLLLAGTSEQTAGHAWVEAHVDGLGWVGFDAANNICPNDRYIRVACGLDYRDAAPVTGIRLGDAAEALVVAVNVEQ